MGVKIEEIIHPFPKGFAALSMKPYIDDLTKRYKSEVKDKINLHAFQHKGSYYVYGQVPSKGNSKYPADIIFYDVALQLTPPNILRNKDDNIRDWDVKVFNNIPSFMFTFDYAFNKRDGLIKLPRGYYSDTALKFKAKVRNPNNLLGIDEGLWFLIMYMDENELFNRTNIDRVCDGGNITYDAMVKTIVPQEKKLKDVNSRHADQAKPKEIKLTDSEKKRIERDRKRIEEEREKERHKSSTEALKDDKLLTSNLSSNLNKVRVPNKIKTNNLKTNSLKSKL